MAVAHLCGPGVEDPPLPGIPCSPYGRGMTTNATRSTAKRTKVQHQVAGLTVTEWPGTGTAVGPGTGSVPGATVFCLPGLGSSAAAWSALAGALPDARVLSVDLRGRGAGQGLTGPTGLRAHARDVAAILAELDLTEVVVVGHSMGAYLAPLVAQEADDRVAKLVLVDGGIPPLLPFFMGPRLTRFAFTRQMRGVDKQWPDIESLARKAKIGKMVASFPELRPVVLDMLTEEMTGPDGVLRPRADIDRCAADAVDTFYGVDVVPALEAVTVPMVAILAENKQSDGQKPFISDKAVGPWLARKPNLSVTRLKGNHVTVVFADEVRAACSLP